MSNEQFVSGINLLEVVEDMFRVLSQKEKDVIVKRFSLNNEPRHTLESIGQQFSVTRERIRQIEKIALHKLKRTVQTTKLNSINELVDAMILEHGGLVLDQTIVSKILNSIGSEKSVDASIIRLALSINSNLERVEKSNNLESFWHLKEIKILFVNRVTSEAVRILKKKNDITSVAKMIVALRSVLSEDLKDYSDPFIISCLSIDRRIKVLDGGAYGLMSWRHINPKSIRDKAYIILKNYGKPLHFIEIANRIVAANFDRKVVTTQAVHNELIRYEQFVLVGRGLYALKEFGYNTGTVTEVIENLLRETSPLTKTQIIEGVLKQRHVKKGTISLNLQKNPQFVRVGRAVYKLDESKKAK